MKYRKISINYLLLLVVLLFVNQKVSAETGNVLEGKVVNASDGKPLQYVLIKVSDVNLWTTTNEKGFFLLDIKQYPVTLDIRYLGKQDLQLKIKDSNFLTVRMKNDDLALSEVVVTAKQTQKEITSSYDISSTAIDHAQISNISGIMSLLPGGKTSHMDLSKSSSSRITLGGFQREADRPSFGTAVEVDGIRLSNNASFGGVLEGVDPRIISPENIEKVEVITGIPSVENGDLTSGIVKIITKQGVMPFTAKLSSSPRQKQISLFRGMRLGSNAGVLNLSYDYTKSTSDIASPYTSYIRNAFTLKHQKIFFNTKDRSLTLSSTIGGNFGGFDSKADPDQFKNTYSKAKAFNLRGGVNVEWKLNSKLISQINFAANLNYSDHKTESKEKYSSASGKLAFHGTEEGYFVGKSYKEGEALSPIQILQRGHWYQTQYDDSKPINYGLKLKFLKNIQYKNTSNNIKFGVSFSGSGNKGRGKYYENRAYIPTWREYKYKNQPNVNNLAIYIEESFKYKINKEQQIQVVGGVRNDNTFVKDSRYGNVSAFSPRFKFKHTIINKPSNKFFKKLSWYAGWGKSVKLPAFSTLYTRPSYRERLAFVPGALADGTTYYAYHIEPKKVLTNKSLKWQKSRKIEIGIKGKIKGMKFSLSYFNSLGTDRYTSTKIFTPFTHYLTTPHQLTNVSIPYENRSYTIDQKGTVTVHDKTGHLPSEILDKKAKESFTNASYADNNSSPVRRQEVNWILDFGKIKALYTSVRIDGKYYWYKSINKKIQSSYQGDNQLMSDGRPYRYIGYYYGGNNISNGIKNQLLTANATIKTHIPKLRLLISLRIEGTFINSSQPLSSMPDGQRSFKIDKIGQTIPKENSGSIYEGNGFSAMYPLYYTSFDDMNTKVPFREKYLWAFKNDKELFNDLSKMIVTNNRTYTFKKHGYTPYFSANVKVSKEIGKHFKLTFFANNFINNMAKVKKKENDVEKTLLNSGLISPFSYGMSVKIKL